MPAAGRHVCVGFGSWSWLYTLSMTGSIRAAAMARAASRRSDTEPVLLPTTLSALTMIGSRFAVASVPVTKPMVNTVPPEAAALIERAKVADPPVSTIRSAPMPSVNSSTLASQSGVVR